MDSSILFLVIPLLFAGVDKAWAVAIVKGSVFCNQCKDGKIIFFDYPLFKAKISLTCPGNDGKPTVLKKGTTNWFSGYMFKFDDSPDLSQCHHQLNRYRLASSYPILFCKVPFVRTTYFGQDQKNELEEEARRIEKKIKKEEREADNFIELTQQVNLMIRWPDHPSGFDILTSSHLSAKFLISIH